MPVDTNQYEALTAGVGYAELRDWTQIELTGADRLKFLNNFCTADLRNLSPDQGTEAFICNVKGKVLGHVYILNDYGRLILLSVSGQTETLINHLDRYTLNDDVTINDVGSSCSLLQLAGAKAEELLTGLFPTDLPVEQKLPERYLESRQCCFGLHAPLVTRGLFGSDSFLLSTTSDHVSSAAELLRTAGAVACADTALDTLRIEAGVPLYGRDITIENLPQEVNRNAQAISFTKGCYLGQETVARIDALGHVNRLLVRVRFDGEQVPADGAELTVDGKAVGQVTSAAFSPRLGKAVTLAYVRTASAEPGSRLQSNVGEAEVIA